MADDSEHLKPPTWKVGLVMLGFRLLDAGLAPWVLVGAFILVSEYILTRNMSSADTLKLWSQLLSRAGYAWFGWLVALVEIPLFAWTLKKEKTRHWEKEQVNQKDADRARQMLKQQKQDELKLK